MGTWSYGKFVALVVGLVLGISVVSLIACEHVTSGLGDVTDASTEGYVPPPSPISVGALNGQPFGPIPVQSDLCSGWQDAHVCSIQNVPVTFTDAGQGMIPTINEAGVLVLQVPYQPAVDGGFPSASAGQFFVQGSTGPQASSMSGDIACSTSTPAKCTLVGLNGIPFDAGGYAASYVLTAIDGGVSWQPGTASFALDLAANPDGGAGQIVVGVHGAAGGSTLVPWYNPGISVDPAQSDFTIQYGAEAGVSAVPGDINFTPQRPNVGASSTSTGSPGEINENLFHPVSTGTWPTWNVVAVDDSNAYLWAMGQIGSGSPPSAYLWGPVPNGTPLTANNYTLYATYGAAGTTNINAQRYINFNVAENTIGALTLYQPGTGPPGAVTAHGGAVFGESTAMFQAQVVDPVYGFFPAISDVATQPVSLIGQSAYSAASGAHQNAGPVPICGGEHAGATGATDGVVTLGAGWVSNGTYPVCNVTETVDGQGALFQSSGGAPSCVAGKGRVGADSSGNMWGCDSSGSAYRLNGGAGGSATGVYGNGQDGAYVLDGSTDYSPAIVLASPNLYGFNNIDIFATTFVVNSGVFVAMNGGALHASVSVTIHAGGVLDAQSGSNGASGGAGGAGGTTGNSNCSLGNGSIGGNGGVGVAGFPGQTTARSFASLAGPSSGGNGGASIGSLNPGGAASTVVSMGGRTLSLPGAAQGMFIGYNAGAWGTYRIEGGGAGGGGGATGSGVGGGGGASAGVGVIAAPTITNSGIIQAIGGNGGQGSKGGGGGGGAGGLIYIISSVPFTGNAPNVAGGSAGAGDSGGANGVFGAAGQVVYLGP